MHQVILLHEAAPPKPPTGATCNGCGACCAVEPCPLGALVSGRPHGACVALTWVEPAGCYRCGLIVDAAAHLPVALRWMAPLASRLAHRYISAGSGCDASLDVTSP